jgi:hypothetical protein
MRGAAVIPVTTPSTSVKELARRVADGVEVTLLWNERTNTVFLRVYDERSGDDFELVVPPAAALDAFHHPYAYASFGGVEYAAGKREPVYA